MTTTDNISLQKVLTIGRDRDVQQAAQKFSAEMFSADDFVEARNLIDNIDFDVILIENIFCPADVREFFNATSVDRKSIIVETDSMQPGTEKDYLSAGAFAYLPDKSFDNFPEVIKDAMTSDNSDNRGFFFNSVASSASIVGGSHATRQTLKMIELVGSSCCNPVLIIGDTGTGKESAARAVHQIRHPGQGFVAVNCAALTANLLESELFGHVKGAFTGADREKTGLLELAAGGSVFLDEISEIPLELQAKLLRVLQEKTFRKVGGLKDITCDATVIASSNRNLKAEVEAKKFRADLYYRLNICPIVLHSLNSVKRRQDIPLLAEYFLQTSTIHPEKSKKIKGFTSLAMDALGQYHWPGNVRELKNVIERAVLLETSEKIGLDNIMIDPTSVADGPDPSVVSPSEKLKDFSLIKAEQELIRRALCETNGQKTRAASLLGITRATLYAKLKQYDIEQDKDVSCDSEQQSMEQADAEEQFACITAA